MKQKLIEEIGRIHTITYGINNLHENRLIDKIKNLFKKKNDDPKKSDYLTPNVQNLYDILKASANEGGIKQQKGGGYTFQISVESLQIGLELLGYNLPVHGVDGMYGPETARAVNKFKLENSVTGIKNSNATPETLLKMIELLKEKDITSDDIKKYLDLSRGEGSLEGVAATDFDKIVYIIIDKLEGGYYHPKMLRDGRVKDSRYGNSGETMFGLDRKAGGDLNKTPEGIKFWEIIDNANASQRWPWNYKGGEYASELKKLVAGIIKRYYKIYSKKYLTNESMDIINSSAKLTFHFIYATYNGPGFFQEFAREFNNLVRSGVTDVEELKNKMMRARKGHRSSLIAQGGRKIETFIDTALT